MITITWVIHAVLAIALATRYMRPPINNQRNFAEYARLVPERF